MKTAKTQEKRQGWYAILLKYGIPLIISAGLCWLLFRSFDFHEMWQLISTECYYRWICLMLVISMFSHVVRAMRWQIQLKALDVNPPLFNTILSIFGMYAVNLVFPRLGEIWRTGYIAKLQGAPFATIFGSMVADRLADLLTVLVIMIIAFSFAMESLHPYLSQPGGFYDTTGALFGSPVVWGLAVLMISFVWWLLTSKSENRIVCRTQQLVKGLWQGFAVVTKMRGRLRWIFLTFLLWGCYFMQLYVAFYSFPFTTELLSQYGPAPALVAFALSSVAMGVPSYGGIGPWQWAVIFALGIYGLNGDYAGAFANLVLGANTLLVIALGLLTFTTIALMPVKTNNKQSHNS